MIRLAFPQLTAERRKEMVKIVKHRAEEARVAVRNVRRAARHDLEAFQKEGELSEPIWSESKSFILQVVHRTEIPGRTFEQVKTELMADASDARRSELFQKWFDARIRSTHIQVSRYYGTWDPGLETVR